MSMSEPRLDAAEIARDEFDLRRLSREPSVSEHLHVEPSAALARLLLIEPDVAIGQRLATELEDRGIEVTWCRDEAAGLLAFGTTPPSMVLAAAPGAVVGIVELVRALRRETTIPIVVGEEPGDSSLTRGAMRAGASAFIRRPYDAATVEGLMPGLRRLSSNPGAHEQALLVVDRGRFEATFGGVVVALSHRELDVLTYLIRQRGRTVSQDDISQAVWGHAADTNTVAVHIGRLRTKLGRAQDGGAVIRTVRGVGYVLRVSARLI